MPRRCDGWVRTSMILGERVRGGGKPEQTESTALYFGTPIAPIPTSRCAAEPEISTVLSEAYVSGLGWRVPLDLAVLTWVSCPLRFQQGFL
jgi:hypothetical protein